MVLLWEILPDLGRFHTERNTGFALFGLVCVAEEGIQHLGVLVFDRGEG